MQYHGDHLVSKPREGVPGTTGESSKKKRSGTWKEGMPDKRTLKNVDQELWMLLCHRLRYDHKNATNTGRRLMVRVMSYDMHLAIFAVLRTMWWQSTAQTQNKTLKNLTWQRLPEPFREWLEKKHPSLKDHFTQDEGINTVDLYRSTSTIECDIEEENDYYGEAKNQEEDKEKQDDDGSTPQKKRRSRTTTAV